MHFTIVTFNGNEAAAIDAFLNQLNNSGKGWRRDGGNAVRWGKGFHNLLVRHHPLGAQGNVIAATQLAQFYTEAPPLPDFVIFYGCAGVVDPKLLNNVFLVGQASYASLGTVSPGSATGIEAVTLKNKWLCLTDPKEVQPIASVSFPDVLGEGTIDLSKMTGIPVAHVFATDKVVKVPASSVPPRAKRPGPPQATYAKGDWTYAQALSYTQQLCSPLPLLVEMESFGIGMLATALKWVDRVVIIRVTTDSLVDHIGSDDKQRELLLRGKLAVWILIRAVVNRAWGRET